MGILKMESKFNGKTALVTAASTGIGRAIAVALANQGARVALVARSLDGLKKTQEIIREKGGHAEIFVTDLRDEIAIDKLVDDFQKKWGTADIIVNAAGVWHDENKVYAGVPLAETPTEQINDVLNVGIRAPFLITRRLLPGMIRKRQGKILQISGTFESGASGWLHYYVSKKAIEHFTEGLAQELRPNLIQVNAISPSDTYTEAYARFFKGSSEAECVKPDEIARLAVFLLSEEADNITGQVITIRSKFAK
jgi:NAD(P)-dependent dehydrogenase (short-subunit alcohol dehydrogenase family)